MASAASRHRSSRSRRPVTNTPIGNLVSSSRPAGTQAEGSPSRLAGTTGRMSSMVAAVPAGSSLYGGHWTPAGHILVAERLSGLLSEIHVDKADNVSR
jgi:hypothetical protein